MILLRIVHAVPRLIHTHELDSPERVGVPIPSGVVDRSRTVGWGRTGFRACHGHGRVRLYSTPLDTVISSTTRDTGMIVVIVKKVAPVKKVHGWPGN